MKLGIRLSKRSCELTFFRGLLPNSPQNSDSGGCRQGDGDVGRGKVGVAWSDERLCRAAGKRAEAMEARVSLRLCRQGGPGPHLAYWHQSLASFSSSGSTGENPTSYIW